MQHLDFAYASSLIRTFTNDDSLVLTIRGRKYTPKIAFRVGDTELVTESVQTEVDAGYEGRSQVVLVEAKSGATTNTIIRQLFYPFRQWQAHTAKPVMTIFFRNFYSSLPVELFKAARVDGAGVVRTFASVMLPMSTPMIIVAVILQVTGIWNDFLLGLIFAGRENLPMTVQLNNIVNSTQGERAYNVDMAATLLTALVPLAVYFGSGRWFVRGIAAGAVKG